MASWWGRGLGVVVTLPEEDVLRLRAEHREAVRGVAAAARRAQEAEELLVRERRPEAQAALDAALQARQVALAHLALVREKALLLGVSFAALEG